MQNSIKNILLTLAEQNVDFVLCGGVACVLQGVERMTMDVDILMEMSNENILRFLKAVKSLKMRPRVAVVPEILMDPVKIKNLVKEKNALVMTFENPDNSFFQLDVMLDSSRYDYFSWLKFSESIPIGKNVIRVLNRPGLIKMKKMVKPLRPKDKFDLEILETLIEKNKSKTKKER